MRLWKECSEQSPVMPVSASLFCSRGNTTLIDSLTLQLYRTATHLPGHGHLPWFLHGSPSRKPSFSLLSPFYPGPISSEAPSHESSSWEWVITPSLVSNRRALYLSAWYIVPTMPCCSQSFSQVSYDPHGANTPQTASWINALFPVNTNSTWQSDKTATPSHKSTGREFLIKFQIQPSFEGKKENTAGHKYITYWTSKDGIILNTWFY